jgi:tRNA(Ile)-lysidine synthase
VDSEALAKQPTLLRAVHLIRDAVYHATVRIAGLTANDRVLVAVSGGPDSLVVLDALLQTKDRGGPIVHALHVDHGWTPNSSVLADTVADTCRRRGVSITIDQASSTDIEKHESPEMSARRIRRACLQREAMRLKTSRIVTGHNADDQVETVLMNLARGSGPIGPRGMAQDDGQTLRPLLSIWRSEIETYLTGLDLCAYRDPANDSPAFRRNRIRHELVPLLESIYPGARRAVLRSASLANKPETVTVRAVTGIRMPVARNRRAVTPGPLHQNLTAAIREDHGSTGQISAGIWHQLEHALANNVAGVWIQLPAHRWAFVRDRAIAVYPERVNDPPITIPIALEIGTTIELPNSLVRIDRTHSAYQQTVDPHKHFITDVPSGSRLCIRTPKSGDQIISSGDGKAHDLTRYLQRSRVPEALRSSTPLLVINNQLACVLGVGVSNDFKPRPEAATVLVISTIWTPFV